MVANEPPRVSLDTNLLLLCSPQFFRISFFSSLLEFLSTEGRLRLEVGPRTASETFTGVVLSLIDLLRRTVLS